MFFAEYIWIDGTNPTKQLRAKTRVIRDPSLKTSTAYSSLHEIPLSSFPRWTADGSSTSQAIGRQSDITLVPVTVARDPMRLGHFLVLCEVFDEKNEPHNSNTRAPLRSLLQAGLNELEPIFGFEQEYTLMDLNGRPHGFPAEGFPSPQGPYYCGVGSNQIKGREFYEAYMQACADAGLAVTGFNWEVMPGQAEVQVCAGALEAGDHVWLARWLLHRVSEAYTISISLDPKPAQGDWNGAGMHTNFSTAKMRAPGGASEIESACVALSKNIEAHLSVYGVGYEERLTGDHETCSYQDFKWGVSDRTASIRIPSQVATEGYGYLEDRRPNANADPYEVATQILKTTCSN